MEVHGHRQQLGAGLLRHILQVLHQQRGHALGVRLALPLLRLRAKQREGFPSRTGSPGPANSVGVCLDVAGNIEGDHGADGGDVQPSGGHVGGDQKVLTQFPEPVDDPHALVLLQISMQDRGISLHVRELLLKILSRLLGLGEDHHLTLRKHCRHPRLQPGELLFFCVEDLHVLLHVGGSLACCSHRDPHGLVQEVRSQALDTWRHGGGEQQGLSLRPHVLQNGADLVLEAHLQHAVRFVQDQKGAALQVAALHLHNVNEASWSCDHDLAAAFDGSELLILGEASREGGAS
mmetsp:Transcript_92026/g.219176  ORF Transcript_92026/g.219176 Transcript_92026/m.219176 type:complete len:291 (+) Transcript_92026:3-875(+)